MQEKIPHQLVPIGVSLETWLIFNVIFWYTNSLHFFWPIKLHVTATALDCCDLRLHFACLCNFKAVSSEERNPWQMGREGKSQISDVRSAQTSVWGDLELVKNDKGMVMWKELILWTNAGASSHYPVKRLLISPGRSYLRVGEGHGVSPVKPVLELSPRFQWYLNRDVCASCGSSDTFLLEKQLINAMGEPSRGKKFISNLYTPLIFSQDISCHTSLFFLQSERERKL